MIQNYGNLFCEDRRAMSQYVLFTPSTFAKTSLIYPQEAGVLRAVRPYETGRSGLSSFLFFEVLSGSGVFLYDGERYELRPGSCVFIDCRKKYAQISSKDLWTLQWVHMNGGPMEAIYNKYRQHGGKPVFITEHPTQYQDLIREICALAGDSSYVIDMELAQKLSALLTMLMQETLRKNRQRHRTVSKLDVGRVKAYLDESYGTPVSLDALAEKFFIDKYYLTKIFKAEYDTTINHYLNHVRITRAKELLRFSDESVEEIGRQVGIPEANYFARVFKRIEGVSPSDYRAQW